MSLLRSLPQPRRNKERWNRTIRNWEHKLTADEKTDTEVDPQQQMALAVLAKFLAYTQIIALLPWYMSESSDKKHVIIWQSHWYAPHAIVSLLLTWLTPLYLVAFVDLFVGYGMFFPALVRGGMFMVLTVPAMIDSYAGTNLDGALAQDIREFRARQKREETDISDIPDSEYLVPDEEMIEFSGSNPIASLRKGESVLALGTTQRGKTSAIKTLAAQLRYGRDNAVVAHGSNDDYTQYFSDDLGLEVLSLHRDGGDVKWNLFREVPPDATEAQAEMVFEDIARGLIPQEGKQQPYFINSARNIFTSCCMILWNQKENPDHADLYSIIFELDEDSEYESKGEQIKQLLKDNGHPTAAEGIRPGEKGDTYSQVTSSLNKQLKGDFRESGEFSFREYFENPAGSVVSVESPESLKSCKETYGVMLDRANKEALEAQTATYMIYDEVGKIGQIGNLDDLAARGLKQRSRLIVGVQSIDAMIKTYGEDLAQTVIGNMTQMISFESKTRRTTEYIQNRLGQRTEIQQSRNLGGGTVGQSRTESEVRRHPIDSSTIENFPKGVGLVFGPNDWWYLRWMHPDEAIPLMAESRGSVGDSTARASESRAQQQGTQQPQQPQQPDGWDSEGRDAATDWVDVSNTDDGGRR